MEAKIYQLDFFKDPEICRLEAMIENQKKSQDRVRKRLFVENNKNRKIIEELSIRLEIIERNICRGDY